MGDPPVTPEDTPARIDDVAGLAGLRPEPGHQRGVGALRHKADVLAVGLLGDRQREIARQGAGLVLGEAPQRKAQKAELRPGRAIEEIALVAGAVAGAMQLRPGRSRHPPRVMAGRQRAGAKLTRGVEEVAELDALVAAYAWDRGLAASI